MLAPDVFDFPHRITIKRCFVIGCLGMVYVCQGDIWFIQLVGYKTNQLEYFQSILVCFIIALA